METWIVIGDTEGCEQDESRQLQVYGLNLIPWKGVLFEIFNCLLINPFNKHLLSTFSVLSTEDSESKGHKEGGIASKPGLLSMTLTDREGGKEHSWQQRHRGN